MFLELDKAILKRSKVFGNTSRGFKILLLLYNIFPASASKGWIIANMNLNGHSIVKHLTYFVEINYLAESRRKVPTNRGSQRIVKSYRLTVEGKKVVEQMITEVIQTLPDKHQKAVIENPIFNLL